MKSPADYNDDLRLAHVLADSVDSVSMERFKSRDLHVETKPDMTPVSDADIRVEELLRAQLGRTRPRDAIIGEEFGETGEARRVWVLDPIDGTKNFVRGVPVWATLIGLIEDGVAKVGLVSAPALGKRWWASPGGGAWMGSSLANATRITVSGVDRIADASLSYSSLGGWDVIGKKNDMLRLMDDAWRTRGYGDFWSYMLVAEGAADLAAEPELNLYDMAALVPIVVEAGGRFTSLDGVDGPFGAHALATNSLLHDAALGYIGTGEEGTSSE